MTTGWAAGVLLGSIVLLGASVQRLAGLGLGLVAVPGLVLILGAQDGVSLANCAAGVISLIGLAAGWRELRLPAVLPLVAAAACTVPLGAWTASRLPEPVLLVGMGVLVSVSVLLVIGGLRVPALRGRTGAVAAGAASGFMNSSAGVGGPAVTLYGVNAGWTVPAFVANAQFYGLVVNAMSVAAKGAPVLAAPVWLMVAAGVAGGALIGRALASRVPERGARRLMMGLALGGGVATLVKGLSGL